MAVSIEAAFVLLDKASPALKEIRRQALLTDKALRGGGGGTGGMAGYTRQYSAMSAAVGGLGRVTKDLGTATDKTAKKIENAGGWFKRTATHIKDFWKNTVAASKVVVGLSTTLGGLAGAVKGVATAFPPMIWGALAAAPAIVALTGAIGALVSSLAFAVGGGVLLGGGLLGSFAVGLGSIAAIAKPALTGLQKYQKAVTALNTAIASGSPTAIKNRQRQLDAIAKANPGVAALAGNLKKFETQWKSATKPARASFFKLAADGIQTLRKLIPTLARESNLNTQALQESFHKILAPFLDSNVFKGFVSGLGGIFRQNLPGFMTGLVNVFTGLASILRVLTPQLDRAGPSFAKFTGNFAKWAASAGGKSTIQEMGRAFSAWLDLVKQIARIIGSVIGAGAGPGTNEVTKWADKLGKFADTLKKPATKGSMGSFFTRALDDVNKLWPVLKSVAADLAGIYKVWKPLGSIVATVIKTVPAWVIAVGSLAWVGGKGAFGAVKGAKGVWDFFKKQRGDTPLNPMWVAISGGGGPGGPSGGGPLRKVTSLAEKILGGTAATRLLSVVKGTGPLLLLGLLLESTDWLPKTRKPTTVPRTASNLTGKPPAGFDVTTGLPRYTVPRTASNPTGLLLGQQPAIHYLPGQRPVTTGPSYAAAFSPKNALDYIKQVQSVRGNLAMLTPKQLDALKTRGDALMRDKNLGKYKDQVVDLRKSLDDPSTGLHAAVKKTAPAFDYMKKGAGKSLDAIVLMSKFAIDQINATLPAGSAAATQALAQNYDIAAGDIRISMQKGVINTQQGIAMIAQLMTKAFETLGISTSVAKNLAKQGFTVAQVQKSISSGAKGGLTAPGASPMASTVGGSSYQYTGHATGGRLPGPARGDHLPLMGRGGKLLGIADGGELVVNRHTEAKADKFLAAFGTRLSDMVSNETTPHFARGGRLKRSFQTGGAIPYSGLEGLWNAAGGPANMAPLMAAVAMAESSGNPSAHNASGATGLWQILGNPFPGNAYDPVTNAKMAVAKFRSQGLGAWVAYTSGAYKRFMQGNVPPGAFAGGGGAAIPVLTAPHVAGLGAMQALGQGVVNNVTKAANAYLQANAPMAGTSGGGTAPGPTGGPTGVGTYKGIRMANWVIAALQYAASKGAGPQPTSGYRPGFDPHTLTGGSEHAGTQYPHGAVDFGGYTDPVAFANKMAVVNATSGFKWPLLAPIGFHDDGHASGTGHALGGRLPWYAQGTDFVANRPQVIGVGDTPGGERVTVTPQGQGRIGNQALHVEIHKIEVNRKGDVQRIVDEELRLLAATIERHI
jgi:hypothetical protein